jgi:hypothetical protein
MMNNSVKKGPVRIAKETASTWTCANPYTKTNVNVAQGPRTGNPGTISKRHDFQDAKAEREPIATMIEDAFAAREDRDYADKTFPRQGAIEPDVKPKRLRR